MKLKSIGAMALALLSSCSPPKTVYITNKTGNAITLVVDSTYMKGNSNPFADSLDQLTINRKKVFNYGKGKWTKADKARLQELLKHTRMIKDGSNTPVSLPGKTNVSLISFNVEELWLNIK